jgi:hypothetical protein
MHSKEADMRRTHLMVKGAVLALVATLAVAAAGGAVTLDPQTYYCFSVGNLAVGIQTLSVAAAEGGFDVLAYSDNTVSVLHGTQTASGNVQQILLSSAHLLVVDGDRFYLRVNGATISYAIRPANSGLELIVSPKAEIDLVEALTSVLVELQDVGIVGMDLDLDGYRAVTRNALKGPAAPPDLAAKLDYVLYELGIAEDWFTYASQKGLALLGLHIEVVVEKVPGGTLPAAFSADVLSQTSTVASLVVPVDQLASLARSIGVGYVRLPYVPVAP